MAWDRWLKCARGAANEFALQDCEARPARAKRRALPGTDGEPGGDAAEGVGGNDFMGAEEAGEHLVEGGDGGGAAGLDHGVDLGGLQSGGRHGVQHNLLNLLGVGLDVLLELQAGVQLPQVQAVLRQADEGGTLSLRGRSWRLPPGCRS